MLSRITCLKLCVLIVYIFLWCSVNLAAGKDYAYFINQNEGGFSYTGTNDEKIIYPETIEKALHTKECLPSSADPEGNWRPTNAGFQLSVRFEKSEFTNNEPVVVMFLVRNVSDEWRAFSKHNGFVSDFIIIGPDGQKLDRSDIPKELRQQREMNNRPGAVNAGMQYKDKMNLRQHYDFSAPGKYTVSLKLSGSLDYPKPEKEDVISGKAVIVIKNTQ